MVVRDIFTSKVPVVSCTKSIILSKKQISQVQKGLYYLNIIQFKLILQVNHFVQMQDIMSNLRQMVR